MSADEQFQKRERPAMEHQARQPKLSASPAPEPAITPELVRRARRKPGSLTPQDVLQLQRTIGNRAVNRLLARSGKRQASPPISGSVIQRQLGENVELVAQEDRFFETVNKAQRLRVDSDNDAYLEDIFKEVSRFNKTDSSLADKLVFALDYFKTQIPYNKAGKIEAFATNVQLPSKEGAKKGEKEQEVRNLGTMLHAHAATCWEKSALFHLTLAEMGIASVVEGGYKKTSGVGHAWVLLTAGLGKDIVLDPTWNKISKRSDYEAKYNITVPQKQVASPKVAIPADQLKTALIEANKIMQGADLWKKYAKMLVEEKANVLKRQEERGAEKEKFDKLLKELASL